MTVRVKDKQLVLQILAKMEETAKHSFDQVKLGQERYDCIIECSLLKESGRVDKICATRESGDFFSKTKISIEKGESSRGALDWEKRQTIVYHDTCFGVVSRRFKQLYKYASNRKANIATEREQEQFFNLLKKIIPDFGDKLLLGDGK